MTVQGVVAVARQELQRRIRAGRWRWLLVAWFLVLTAFTALLRFGVDQAGGDNDTGDIGSVMYGGLQLFLLALALLVVPALTAQSVNGDRERGVLATLQVTRLSAFEIAAGKLLAAWGASLVFVAASAPLVFWSMLEGGVPLTRVLVVTLVVALLLGVVCAVSLGLSAVLARSTTSAVLSYLSVFALTLGTLITFGLVTAVTAEHRTVRPERPAIGDPAVGDIPESYTETVARTDRTWWLLAPNPFVVLADVAPGDRSDPQPVCRDVVTPEGTTQMCTTPTNRLDPLGGIARSVRDLRDPPLRDTVAYPAAPTANDGGDSVWPWGLAADLLLGGGMLVLATRRLRTPTRRLPTGVRVA